MSVHSRPSIQYQDGIELRDKKMTKDCAQLLTVPRREFCCCSLDLLSVLGCQSFDDVSPYVCPCYF